MIITKVLNNNAFVALDDNNKEIIVMGRGVGFKKKAGQKVELMSGAQVFSNQDQSLNSKMKEVIANIPGEYLDITEKVVSILSKEYNKKVHDIIYVSLTEHIQSAVERYTKGFEIENPLLNEIKRIYREEYEVAVRALELIKDKFGVEFTKDEAGYIAYHIVNAELDGGMNNVAEMTHIVENILNIVKKYMNIEYNEESLHYDRFITHLKFFAQRILCNTVYNDDEEELFSFLKTKYPQCHDCMNEIKKFIEEEYMYKLTESEQMYLIIHIQRIVSAC